ncbi:hypothetical protein FRUB_09907 [Fimbriiglobus ruber]|uniref:Putative beta-lactamase-inhibitor-like PepSY-like domain-containing protein n=2 Tax=Fimbriiglobus ruber TaxID=1908690 RepID=A0A225DF93_9BACT|nr:hypothetical protein FRUB_09907 [Fimbriiglobus ruber]
MLAILTLVGLAVLFGYFVWPLPSPQEDGEFVDRPRFTPKASKSVDTGKGDEKAEAVVINLALKQVPGNVMSIVRNEFPGGKPSAAYRVTEADGTVHYTVTLTVKKTDYEITVSPDGVVLEMAKEIEFKNLPAAAKRLFAEKYPKSKVKEVAELTEPGVSGKKYHIEFEMNDGTPMEVVFDADGKLISEE